MAIAGDTLCVADIDKLRGFDRMTGAPIATIDFAPQGATLLNDVAVGPGDLRVTDTGIRMDDKGTTSSDRRVSSPSAPARQSRSSRRMRW
jgi:hypothetical protein